MKFGRILFEGLEIMIEVKITPEIIEQSNSPQFNLRKGIHKYLSLAVCAKIFVDLEFTKDCDFVYCGKKINLMIHHRSNDPKPHFDIAVPATESLGRADVLVFVSLIGPAGKTPTRAVIIGCMDTGQFKKEAVFREAGKKEEGSNRICKEDCFEIPIRKMRKPKELVAFEV